MMQWILKKQYYTLLENYRSVGRDYSSMAYLARTAAALNDKDVAREIAKDYTDHFLIHLNNDALYTKENIQFLRQFTASSKDRGFAVFYQHEDKIDKIMEMEGYAEGFVDFIIAKEEIDPILWPADKASVGKPEWDKMTVTITSKYDSTYADRTIAGAKARWYGWKEDWPDYTRFLVQKIEMTNGDHMDGFTLNNDCWAIFQRCADKIVLSKAAFWMEKLVQKTPDWATAIDTYANLLYKVGKTHEALNWEEKAAGLAPKDKDVQDAFVKMKNNQSTWQMN